jgi:predicted aconitase with swiveling domain
MQMRCTWSTDVHGGHLAGSVIALASGLGPTCSNKSATEQQWRLEAPAGDLVVRCDVLISDSCYMGMY